MDLESAIIDLNNTVWKHTKHIEEQKKAFSERATQEVAQVNALAAACDKTELFINEIESRLEETAQNASHAEILLYQMLEKAQNNLESTQIALDAARARLNTLQTDYNNMCKIEQEQKDLVRQYTSNNCDDVALWEKLLGLGVSPQKNGIQVQIADRRICLEKLRDNYVVTCNGAVIDLKFDGSLARFLLAVRSIR